MRFAPPHSIDSPWVLVSHVKADTEALAQTVVEFEMGKTRVA